MRLSIGILCVAMVSAAVNGQDNEQSEAQKLKDAHRKEIARLKDEHAKNLEAVVRENVVLKADLELAHRRLADIAALTTHLARLAHGVPRTPLPDGRVVKVDSKAKTAWINLGMQDHVKPKQEFRVFGLEQLISDSAAPKAQLEVTRVSG